MRSKGRYLLFLAIFGSLAFSNQVFATAKQSSISLSVDKNVVPISIIPSLNGTFGASDDVNISVNTDNFSGYTLSIKTNTSRNLVSSNNASIGSISSPISEQTFISNSSYANQFGYKPSKHVVSVNNVNTTVTNTDYLPVPSTSVGDYLDITNASNSIDNEYTLSFGVKVNTSQPAGIYSYTYVISAVGNANTYNINYVKNTDDDVSNLPSPNPQAVIIEGGTATAQSYTTLSNNVPSRTGYTFVGWCDEATTLNTTSGNQECAGTIYDAGDDYGIDQTADGTNIQLYAIWNINLYTITFMSQGGSPATISFPNKKYGEALGTLPAPTKVDYVLEGWYPNTNYNENEKISPSTIVENADTYYAHWVETLFPVVWEQMGACEFHGATNDNITGTDCEDYRNDKFIDTGIALYSQSNYLKDYEIHLTIDHYDPSEQVNYYSGDNDQQTFVNDKLSSTAGDGKAPGVVVRRSGASNIDINSKFANHQQRIYQGYVNTSDISIFRLDNVIYYSINNGPLVELQDITGFNQQFGLTTWFGAYPADSCTGDNGPCTNAKRIPEATFSNMYIRLGEYSDDDIHTINFNGNEGTVSSNTYLIKDGGAITTLPTVEYTDHIFQGWFTAASGGTEITAATIPDASTTYYAHWKSYVSLANITNSEISLEPEETETINVTNSAELEPYTFSSSNASVATVDSNTGVVTAVAPGSATITMTGATSGTTKTITITVTGQTYTISFDAQGGSPVSDRTIGDGASFDSLPDSTKTGYSLEGWYTGINGTGTQLTTSTVFDSNTATQYYAHWEEKVYVCKIAKTLHTESCERSSDGCRSAGYASDATVTYGTLPTPNSTPVAGNAFTCDVDANGIFDEVTERFYYFGMNGDNAKLIYYKNVQNVNEDYATALNRLPDSNTWGNTYLTTFDTKVSRFMTREEAVAACNNSTSGFGTNGKCLYLLEQSNFTVTSRVDGYWLGSNDNSRLHSGSRKITNNSGVNAARPVIEVPMENISLEEREYDITFDPHDGTNNTTTVTINPGDTLGINYPATDPTYANHLFQGWFTAETGGTQISSSTEPNGSTTYHAQWLKTVALAELNSNSFTIEKDDTATINVTNSAELEGYSFSSNDTSVATVNSSTGVITAVEEGTTTITMTGTTSNATKSISVEVVDELQPYTVTFNAQGGDCDTPSTDVAQNTAIGPLPTATKTGYRFFGWYTNNTNYYTEVTPATVVTENVTYYARWIEDTASLPIVFAEINACNFNGNSNITGDYCTQNKTKNYVDSGVSLFTNNNKGKDFEIGFNIVSYDSNDQVVNNATLVNSKKEDSAENYPGFVMRRLSENGNETFDLTARFSNISPSVPDIPSSTKEVRIYRRNGVISYSIDGGSPQTFGDVNSNTKIFDTAVWFGAATASNGTSSFRPLVGILTDMYVRLAPANSQFAITFDPNGGQIDSNDATRTVNNGDSLGSPLPTPTRVGNYTFVGWYTDPDNGNAISAATEPEGNDTYYAHWSYTSSNQIVSFNTTNDAAGGYYDTIDSWVSGSANITTFNKSTTVPQGGNMPAVNYSTWGDTSVLSESDFWDGIQDNFEANNCNMNTDYNGSSETTKSWASGSVDCSKPKVYDTGVGDDLKVYLYNTSTSTVGDRVYYTKSDNGTIANMVPGQTYYWEKDDDNTIYGYVAATADHGRRMIDAGSILNVRDLGGLGVDTDNDGIADSTLKYEKIYRGAKLGTDSSAIPEITNLALTSAGQGTIIEYDIAGDLGTQVSLQNKTTSPIIHYQIAYPGISKNGINNSYSAARDTLTAIMDSVNAGNSVYFHCRVGADRTGTIAYLLEGLLGVVDEERYEDYELTHLSGLTDRTRYYVYKNMANSNYYKFVYMMGDVPTKAKIYEWYMQGSQDPTADDARIQSFRSNMIQ